MSEKTIQPIILSQLEDVLEERQRSDRRTKEQKDADAVVAADRRKDDRRSIKK